MNENAAKLKELLADEAFFMSLIEAENEEAVQKKLADKGVEMSLTEIELMKEMIGAVADGKLTEGDLEKLSSMGELSEDELEQAAGGNIADYLPDFLVTKTQEVYTRYSIHRANNIKITEITIGANWGRIGAIAAGTAAVAYGVYTFKDEIAEGAETAYGWVSENITRW